jgi:myo-inositol 2-dehydrogenase/D-chiro-inositol 1-dehydrogenase
MINICIIGAGRIAKIHAKNLSTISGVNILYIVDKSIEVATELAIKYNAKVSSLNDALKDPLINAVVILSPTHTHADYMELAAKAGKHIFCEKPIDLDVLKTKKTLKIIEDCGIVCAIGFNRRHDPQFNLLKKSIIEGKVGDVQIVSITSRDPEPPSLDYVESSGGIFKDMMIHDLDMARWLLNDEPVEIIATGSCLIDSTFGDYEDFDTAAVTIKTNSGKICQINNSRKAVYGYDQRIEVFGSKGMLQANNNTNTQLSYTNENGVQTEKPQYFFLERYKDSFKNEMLDFVKCIREGGVPLANHNDGLAALELSEAAIKSISSGKMQIITKL